jgi:hypothetical protein
VTKLAWDIHWEELEMFHLAYYGSQDKSHKEEAFKTYEAALNRAYDLILHDGMLTHGNKEGVSAYIYRDGDTLNDDFVLVAGGMEILEFYHKKHKTLVRFRELRDA